jgi:hypothetical protein
MAGGNVVESSRRVASSGEISLSFWSCSRIMLESVVTKVSLIQKFFFPLGETVGTVLLEEGAEAVTLLIIIVKGVSSRSSKWKWLGEIE